MEIEGKILVIGETQSFGNNGFTKRQIVVETTEQYPQRIPVDFVKDKCVVLDGYSEGQHVKIGINLRGSEYQGKYYLSAQGWCIEAAEGQSNTESAVDKHEAKNNAPAAEVEQSEEEEDDDIGF